jgi:hypothetical protein
VRDVANLGEEDIKKVLLGGLVYESKDYILLLEFADVLREQKIRFVYSGVLTGMDIVYVPFKADQEKLGKLLQTSEYEKYESLRRTKTETKQDSQPQKKPRNWVAAREKIRAKKMGGKGVAVPVSGLYKPISELFTSLNEVYPDTESYDSINNLIRTRREMMESDSWPGNAIVRDGWVITHKTEFGNLMLGLLPYTKEDKGATTPIRLVIQQAIDNKNEWVKEQVTSKAYEENYDARLKAGMESINRIAEKLTEAQIRDIEDKVRIITSSELNRFAGLLNQFNEEYDRYFSPAQTSRTKFASKQGEPCAVDYNDSDKTGVMYAQEGDYSGTNLSPEMKRRYNAAIDLYALINHELIETRGRERANYRYFGMGVQNVTKYCELGEGIAIYFSAKLMEEKYGINYEDAINLIDVQHLFGFDPAGPEYRGQADAVRDLVENQKIDGKVLLSELLEWDLEAWKIPKSNLTPYELEGLKQDLDDYWTLKETHGTELYENESLLPAGMILKALTTYKLYSKETDQEKKALADESLKFLLDIKKTFDGNIYQGGLLERHINFWAKIMPG